MSAAVSKGCIKAIYNLLQIKKNGKKLSSAAKSFQKNTAKRWNPKCDEPTLSMYTGYPVLMRLHPKSVEKSR